uniref:Uncharacterized protein n=1 Tax=Anopheles minimus TaxID=112268 RepID=A0A182WPT0_9DIPT
MSIITCLELNHLVQDFVVNMQIRKPDPNSGFIHKTRLISTIDDKTVISS